MATCLSRVESDGQITQLVFGDEPVTVGYQLPGEQKIHPLSRGTTFRDENLITISGRAICDMVNKASKAAQISIFDKTVPCPHTLWRDEQAFVGSTALGDGRVKPLAFETFYKPAPGATLWRVTGAAICDLINSCLSVPRAQ